MMINFLFKHEKTPLCIEKIFLIGVWHFCKKILLKNGFSIFSKIKYEFAYKNKKIKFALFSNSNLIV